MEYRKFPAEPPLDQVDRSDRAALRRAKAHKIREEWIQVMEARILRDKLRECYYAEGVNHYETCRHLADAYLTAVKEKRVRGIPTVKTMAEAKARAAAKEAAKDN